MSALVSRCLMSQHGELGHPAGLLARYARCEGHVSYVKVRDPGQMRLSDMHETGAGDPSLSAPVRTAREPPVDGRMQGSVMAPSLLCWRSTDHVKLAVSSVRFVLFHTTAVIISSVSSAVRLIHEFGNTVRRDRTPTGNIASEECVN